MPVLAASLPFLGEIVTLFALSALIAYLCTRIRLVPIAGFLLTGVVVGPHAMGLVQDPELVNTLAEIGVILLLFEIGIEFSLASLARLKKAIAVGGGLQVGLTIAVVAGIGVAAGVDVGASLYTGALIALSSTAVVLGLLSLRGETNTPAGQLSLAVLIFQDLAIVAMVLLVPVLGQTGGSGWDVLQALVLAGVVVGIVLVVSRTVVPRLLHAVAGTRRPELFVLVVSALGLGTAWLVSLAGVSLELGAFLAGLVVSESEYREQALSDILPLRSLFNVLFFVSVGMLLDVSFLFEQPLVLLGTVAGVLLLKGLITTGAIVALGYPVRLATIVGLALAQIGEFSFVLDQAGRAAGLSPFGLGTLGEQAFIITAVLLMLVTPGLMQVGPSVGRWLQDTAFGWWERGEADPGSPAGVELEDHVIIVGYGPVGRRLAQVLHQSDLPFVVMDLNRNSIEEARASGYAALYGDATRSHILEEVGLPRAKLCVVAINDAAAARRIVRLARQQNPAVRLLVRAHYLSELGPLREAGADVVFPEELETSIQLFTRVLSAYQIPQTEIREKVEEIRAHDYELLRKAGSDSRRLLLEGLEEEGIRKRTIRLPTDCPAIGRSLGTLRERREFDLSMVAVHRGGDTVRAPGEEFVIEAGDRLVLIGRADAFVDAAPLFRPSEGDGDVTTSLE